MSTQILREFSKTISEEGFDLQAGQTWIYPTNYTLRDYQFSIVQECLYKNTLVSLPTGLGKTFIAAVVMFNFYRWYPSGKVIFMAPTKPLVKQQMEACYNIMAIPKDKTAELTGTKAQKSRKDIWTNKRVFFITPQVLQNDIGLITELGRQIKCIVIDEAHKAKGNHAYCEVMRQITAINEHFRVLALSATPGNTMNDVSEIIDNLFISHLEIRTDDSPDVIPYIFQRTIETVVVPLGEKLQSVKNAYLKILDRYTRMLVDHGVIHGNCANLTKGRVFMIQKDFQERNKHTKIKAYGDIMRNLNLCITLYHGYELLTRHGLRGFLKYFEEHSDNVLLRGNTQLEDIMTDVREYLGPEPFADILPDGTVPELSPLTKFGHPKFYKLLDVLLKHFSTPNNTSSKVIVFTEYRDSVQEIFSLLIHHAPVIRPKYFLGQSAITQKQQMTAIKSFRSGECNTLISTCIGEEGLDIGEVDLIVCFDISNKSPIRIVQRIGRTGRKREGKIVALVTEGREEEMLKECLVNKHYLSKNILKSKNLKLNVCQNNVRMVPDSITPICQKIHISVPKITKTKKGNIKDMFNNMASSSKEYQLFSDVEVIEMQDRIPDTLMLCDKGENMMDIGQDINRLSFSRRLESLRVPQPTNLIGHSTNCDILTSLLQYADFKRYNIPTTQIRSTEVASIRSKKSKLSKHGSSDFIQSDIRTMFLKSQTSSTQTISTNEKHDLNTDLYYTNDLVNELHTEISTYLSLSCVEESNCKICDNLFICYRSIRKDCDIKLDNWIQPDPGIAKDLSLDDIHSFERQLNPTVETMFDDNDAALFENFASQDWDEFNESYEDQNNKDHTFAFEAPTSTKKVLEKSTSSNNEIKNTGAAEISLNKECMQKDLLAFFKLDALSNIFGDNDDDQKKVYDKMERELNMSPTLSKIRRKSNDANTSPILGTFNQKRRLTNVNKKLFETRKEATAERTENKPKESNLNNTKNLNFATQCKDKAHTARLAKENLVKSTSTSKPSSDCISQLLANISDICDMSIFGLEVPKPPLKHSDNTSEVCNNSIDSNEIFSSDSEDLFRSICISPVLSNDYVCTFNDFSTLNIIAPHQNKDEALNHNVAQLSPGRSENIKQSITENKANGILDNKKTINNDSCDFKQALSPVLGCNGKIQSSKPIEKQDVLTAFDICDMSIFGISNTIADIPATADSSSGSKNKNPSKDRVDITLSDTGDFCKSQDNTNLKGKNCSKNKSDADTSTGRPGEQSQGKTTSQLSITQILNMVNGNTTLEDNQATKDVLSVTPASHPEQHKKDTNINKSLPKAGTKRRLSLISLTDDDFLEDNWTCNEIMSGTKKQKSSKKKQICSRRLKPEIRYDSEEEFEESPFKDTGWIRVKTSKQPNLPKVLEAPAKQPNKRKKRKKGPTCYIDEEAVLTSSDEVEYRDSQSEGGSSDDVFETSFVNDETIANTTVMHAKYLQTTRSPVRNKGAFKIPLPPIVKREDIFSQEVDYRDDTYLNDTFCVEDDGPLSQNADLSELEIAEMLLEQKRKAKSQIDSKNRKKKRMIVLSSDSD